MREFNIRRNEVRTIVKRILSGLCAFLLIAGMAVTVAAAEPTPEVVEKIPAIEGRIDQVSNEELQKAAENMRNNFVSSLSEETNSIKEAYTIDENIPAQVNMKSRKTWLLEDTIFYGNGEVSAEDSMDMYIVQTTETQSFVLTHDHTGFPMQKL